MNPVKSYARIARQTPGEHLSLLIGDKSGKTIFKVGRRKTRYNLPSMGKRYAPGLLAYHNSCRISGLAYAERRTVAQTH